MSSITPTPIKIQYNGDIRRASLTSTSFEDFESLVARLFGASAAGQKARYLDEDGDRVLVCNAQDIAEAIEQAKGQKKVLKFFVDAQAKAEEKVPQEANAPSEGQSTEQLPRPIHDSPQSSVYVTDEPEPTKTDANEENGKGARRLAQQANKAERLANKAGRRADRKACKDERQKAKEERRAKDAAGNNGRGGEGGCRWRGQWREHARAWRQKREEERKQFAEDVKSFLADAKIVKDLQDILPVVAEALLKGDDLKSVIDKALAEHPAVQEHQLTKKLLPMWNKGLEMLSPFAEFIRPVLLDVILDLQALLANGKLEDMPAHRLLKRIFCSAKRAARSSAPPMFWGPGFGAGPGGCPFPFWGFGGRMGGGGCPAGFRPNRF